MRSCHRSHMFVRAPELANGAAILLLTKRAILRPRSSMRFAREWTSNKRRSGRDAVKLLAPSLSLVSAPSTPFLSKRSAAAGPRFRIPRCTARNESGSEARFAKEDFVEARLASRGALKASRWTAGRFAGAANSDAISRASTEGICSFFLRERAKRVIAK